MLDMTDRKEASFEKEQLLDALPATSTVPDTPWFPETDQLIAAGSLDSDLPMGPLQNVGDSVKMEDIPPLENYTTAPYASPVHSSFIDTENSSTLYKDVLDLNAQHGVVGLRNLGNTCFLNAGLQCLASNSQVVKFFLEDFDGDETIVNDTLTGAVGAVIRKMWSGRYSLLQPSDFKNTLATYHPQFKDFRQHDCQEFLALLLDSLHEQLNTGKQWHSNKLSSSPTASSSHSDNVSVKSESSSSQSDAGQISGPASPLDSGASTSQAQLRHVLADNQSNCLSEDSNQSEHSESSLASDTTINADDVNRRLAPIPESLKRRNSSQDYILEGLDQNSSVVGEQSSSLKVDSDDTVRANNCSSGSSTLLGKRLPTLEDFYMKGTKTLNTNVLASEFTDESVTMDSDKFHKPDNVANTRAAGTANPYENLSELLLSEVKGASAKPLKETNLVANVRDKFYDTKKCLFSETKPQLEEQQQPPLPLPPASQEIGFQCSSINNIKRMKIDEDEKNVRMQAKLKVNTNKNLTRDVDSHLKAASSSHQAEPRRSGQGRASLEDQDEQVAGGSRSTEDEEAAAEQWQECVLQADRAWAKYKESNQSVIVDTFQGQFKSTVVCSECHHISVTYEPFMYLSVPLPHAMERQMSVIFVPCDSKRPIRYLLRMHKHDNVKKVKVKLRELIGEETCDIILVEVFDNHIARILEENMLLKYVNEMNRTIYAFEMMPPPVVDDEACAMVHDDTSTLTGSLTSGSDETLTGANNLVANNASASAVSCVSPSSCTGGDVFTNMGPFPPTDLESTDSDEPIGRTVINNQNNTRTIHATNLECKGFEGHILNNLGVDGTTARAWGESSDQGELQWQDNLVNTSDGQKSTADKESCSVAEMEDEEGVDACLWKQSSTESDITSGEATWGTPIEIDQPKEDEFSGDGPGPAVTTDRWKSCAICLDEMADRDLMVHTACGGTLCQACLEMSCEHYGEGAFMCPVCSTPVSPSSDFLQLNAMADYKPKTRILPVPIVHRYDAPPAEGGAATAEQRAGCSVLFGHPSLLYLPSHLSSELLYETVDRVVPCLLNYSILLTDGQGYHCSRCMYTSHCSGCEISRDGDVTLQPGDHLAVCYSDVTEDQMEATSRFDDHVSMKEKRPDTPLTLTDCFDAFMDRVDKRCLPEIQYRWYHCSRTEHVYEVLVQWRHLYGISDTSVHTLVQGHDYIHCEVLDEHNPWFCPCCKKNQCAHKTMTVWRYPQALVVYLKRFVFHELTGTKLDARVSFPLDNMDLTDFVSGPKTCNLVFDLHSCVCHFGGVNAGHYTSYARNPVTSEWYYYNDETVTQRPPADEDFKNTYILFYQLQGSDVKFKLPSCKSTDDADVTMALSAPLPAYQPATLNNDAICQFFEELDNGVDSTNDETQESHDFYS